MKHREIENYRQQEAAREVRAWTRSYWQILEAGLAVGRMSSEELVTKLAFFHRRPLRRIAQRNREGPAMARRRGAGFGRQLVHTDERAMMCIWPGR